METIYDATGHQSNAKRLDKGMRGDLPVFVAASLRTMIAPFTGHPYNPSILRS
jgi:hypothetical protein